MKRKLRIERDYEKEIIQKVKYVLERYSAVEIAENIGVTRAGVAKWQKRGEESILKMRLDNVLALLNLYESRGQLSQKKRKESQINFKNRDDF